jgi:hypothetical protein
MLTGAGPQSCSPTSIEEIPMKKVTDETYALTGAGGVQKARFRLFLPEEHESEKNVVLVLSYALQNPSVPVPEWVSALIAQTIQALHRQGQRCLVFVHFPEHTDKGKLGARRPAEVGIVEWEPSEDKAIKPCYRRSSVSKLEGFVGEPLDSPWPTDEVRTLVVMDLLPTDQVYSFEDNKGTEWHWNASLGMRLIELVSREPKLFYPSDHGIDLAHLRQRYPDIDENHAAKADLSRPILFVPFHDGTSVLVDGWHRLWRAVSEGVESLPCYELTPEEARACLIAQLPAGKGVLS